MEDSLRKRERSQKKQSSASLTGFVKRMDMFRKTKHQFIEKSGRGGILTCVVISALLLLVFFEFASYIPLKRRDSMGVDTKIQESLNIFFNVTFPEVKCNKLHVDVVDASGEAQINVGLNIVKNAVSKSGRIIAMGRNKEKNRYNLDRGSEEDDIHSSKYCGKCYMRKYNRGKCCNTCQDVINTLRILKIAIPPKTEIPQCLSEISSMYPGCNMYGVLDIKKVKGNFHFAPGESFSSEKGTRVAHIHEFDPTQKFDCSHIINEIRFGDKFSEKIRNPLDDTNVEVNGTSILKYFIQVVPTKLEYPVWLYNKDAYQYSFTQHIHEYSHELVKMPGVFFVYDFSPIVVTYQYFRPPLFGFVVTLAGVIGGLWAVLQFVNSFYRDAVEQFLRKKHD